jgi:hypothetical protein
VLEHVEVERPVSPNIVGSNIKKTGLGELVALFFLTQRRTGEQNLVLEKKSYG